MTRRQARRKLGSRSNRRKGTNGKVMRVGAAGGNNRRTPCYRHPRPIQNLGWRIQAILDSSL